MKEAIVGPDLAVEVVDCPRPKPSRGDLLIKVACAGCNPKDWKAPHYTGKKANPGDDIAGEFAECGEDVVGFSVGDRVAAVHQMGTLGGAFAEYAIAPATTTFHLLIKVSFEEGATIPLACLTAAIALYHNLRLPPPWQKCSKKTPLLIYGGSTATGAFGIKLARQSHVSPLIVIAGKSTPFVVSLLDASQGDVAIDYRQGQDAVVKAIERHFAHIGAGPAHYAFDTISEQGSFHTLGRVLHPNGHITLVSPEGDYASIPASLTTSLTYVGIAHGSTPDISTLEGIRHVADGDGEAFAVVFCRLFSWGLQAGWLSAHPWKCAPNGLHGLSTALNAIKSGQTSATKYIINPDVSSK
ncbi:hypothetical protein LTR53_004755 [Teratosphaeriaceae sp. CCFEE 6253]|nr:hypothetical protein LTR53_004755 [Teratosphaeriaceae sp. CCFEE 6253]